MKTPKAEIRAELWKRMKPEFERAAVALTDAPTQSKAKAKFDAIIGLCEIAYLGGLDRGYDMAATIFGDE